MESATTSAAWALACWESSGPRKDQAEAGFVDLTKFVLSPALFGPDRWLKAAPNAHLGLRLDLEGRRLFSFTFTHHHQVGLLHGRYIRMLDDMNVTDMPFGVPGQAVFFGFGACYTPPPYPWRKTAPDGTHKPMRWTRGSGRGVDAYYPVYGTGGVLEIRSRIKFAILYPPATVAQPLPDLPPATAQFMQNHSLSRTGNMSHDKHFWALATVRRIVVPVFWMDKVLVLPLPELPPPPATP